jgi:phosphotriesterase-related protein
MTRTRTVLLNRREALGLLGAGLGVALQSSTTRLRAAAQSAPRQVTFPRGAIIRTIAKDVTPETLANGTTLFHEHLDGVYDRTKRNLTLPPPSTADIAPVVTDVQDVMKNGVVCIVDGGHPDMGVNYDHLREISAKTGLHVVASGGYYLQNTYPAEIATMSDDQIAESLVKEAAAGRYGAYGEIGTMPDQADFLPDEKKVFRAVGKAHRRNNLPIFTHNNYGGQIVPREIALKQLDIYEAVGVDPKRIAIGHMDSLPGTNPDIIKALGKRGAYVGIDRIRGEAEGDKARVTLVLAFLEAGYVDQLLLSSDTRRDFNKVSRFVQQLKGAGVTDAMLHTIQVDNPRRFLAFVPKG